jgi:inner membrane protein
MNEVLNRFKVGGLRRSAGFRLVIIVVLTMMFLIPAGMVQSRVWERQGRRNQAVAEVSGKWGHAQTISGPVLTVPYLKYYKDKDEKVHSSRHEAHFLPDELSIDGVVDSEMRYRGIFEVILYTGQISLSGKFEAPNFVKLDVPPENILWGKSYLSVGISDMRGIRESIDISMDGKELLAEPGTAIEESLPSGINAPVVINPKTASQSFSISMDLRGSESLSFSPLGKETTASIEADWGSPSFTGAFLPDSREISEENFSARWQVLHLNRNYPQVWIDTGSNLAASSFGVKLLKPADGYQRTMRTVKYAIMFIFLTFLTFFMIEVLNGRAVHPIQYSLVGSALIVFYVLLLSLSEHIPFNISYIVACTAVITMIALYTRSVLGSNKLAVAVAGMVTLLYGFLFVVLQAEDYALLLGSLGLFSILALTMYLTRRIDWFTVLGPSPDAEAAQI